MVDLSSFSDEKFDPKKWINAACQSCHPEDPLDKHLVDLEMKLQMISEEIAASLEEQSAAALLRVPRASREVIRLRDDALSLRSSVASIIQKLVKAEGSSAESIATLAKVDTVKRRMEAAHKTLQDAADITQLSSTVEDVFASGDLPRAAETLANMRHCLSAVGEVAEFANVRKQLEVLEDRLDSMVQPRLTDALTNRKVEVAKDMRTILIRIGRFKSLEMHYTKVQLEKVKKLWEEFDLRQQANRLANEKFEMQKYSSNESQSNANAFSFPSWLPSFYDELLRYLDQEWKWSMLAFPEDYRTLVPRLVIETMTAIGPSFVSRANLATGDVVPETRALSKGVLDISSADLPKGVKIQTKHLEALIELHNMTGSFARNIQFLFSNADLNILLETLKSIYLPYESFKQSYGQMERVVLSSEVAALDLRGVTFSRFVGVHGVELSETVRRMEESIPQVIVQLEMAVERCINFTGGSEADELIVVLDEIMLQYISALQDILKALRTLCGVDSVNGVGSKKDLGADRKDGTSHARKADFLSNEEEWSFIQATLQILTVADTLSSRSSVFEASLRATLARLNTNLSVSVFGSSADQKLSHIVTDDKSGELSSVGRAALDVAALRLVDVPDKARKLFNLFEQSKDPRFHALPNTFNRVGAFAEAVNELVYDVLISKVRQQFHDLSRLPVWSSVDEPSAFPLPSFSSYPQSYVTNVGEYLLTLPQQLEPLAEGISYSDANADDAQFATEWMFKVAEGASVLFIDQLRGIQFLTDRGAQQLSVDIEYLNSVLSALSMKIPPVLDTFYTCLSTPRDQLKDVVKSIYSGNQLDLPTANLVCRMRRVNLDQ